MHPASMVQPQSPIVAQCRVEGREQCDAGVNATENPNDITTSSSPSVFSQESRGIRISSSKYIYTYNGDNGTNEATPIDRLGRVIKRVGKTGNSNSREERPRHPPRPTTLLLLLRPSLLDRVFFTPVAPLARSLPYKLISRGAPPCCRLARCRTIEFSLSIYLSVCINIYIYI